MYFFLLSCFGAAAQWQHVCTSQYLKLFKIFVLFIWTVICCQSGNASLFTTAAVRQDRESSGSGLWERELLTLFWAERSHLPPRWNFWPRRWSMLVFCCSRTHWLLVSTSLKIYALIGACCSGNIWWRKPCWVTRLKRDGWTFLSRLRPSYCWCLLKMTCFYFVFVWFALSRRIVHASASLFCNQSAPFFTLFIFLLRKVLLRYLRFHKFCVKVEVLLEIHPCAKRVFSKNLPTNTLLQMNGRIASSVFQLCFLLLFFFPLSESSTCPMTRRIWRSSVTSRETATATSSAVTFSSPRRRWRASLEMFETEIVLNLK